MENKLIMSFIDNELYETGFIGFPNYELNVSVRGKTSGVYSNSGSFQWTSAVQALTVLCIRTAAYTPDLPIEKFLLKGTASTMASSLDYAISKSPLWLMDMFGVHLRGEGFVRRLIKIMNSNRKRPGPVILAMNRQMLAPERIEIYVNGQRLTAQQELLDFADAIMMRWGQEQTESSDIAVAA